MRACGPRRSRSGRTLAARAAGPDEHCSPHPPAYPLRDIRERVNRTEEKVSIIEVLHYSQQDMASVKNSVAGIYMYISVHNRECINQCLKFKKENIIIPNIF